MRPCHEELDTTMEPGPSPGCGCDPDPEREHDQPPTGRERAAPGSPPLPAVVRSVRISAPPPAAFERFTTGLASWWPLASHSVGQGESVGVELEGRVGGRILERLRCGPRPVWGTVTAWEPPHRVAFTWHPGRDPAEAGAIDVRFHAAGDGTRVVLEHRGFERLGASARHARLAYGLGWRWVLGLYAGKRGPFMAAIGALTALAVAARRQRRAGSKAAPRPEP